MNNVNVILSKISPKTIDRLDAYVRGGIASSEEYRYSYEARIVTACSVLWDAGIISFGERQTLSSYYRNRLYEGGNAQ